VKGRVREPLCIQLRIGDRVESCTP
jgi:hypothetical protein